MSCTIQVGQIGKGSPIRLAILYLQFPLLLWLPFVDLARLEPTFQKIGAERNPAAPDMSGIMDS
jgi:hypothetical protein